MHALLSRSDPIILEIRNPSSTLCTWLLHFLKTSKEGTRRTYPPACNPPTLLLGARKGHIATSKRTKINVLSWCHWWKLPESKSPYFDDTINFGKKTCLYLDENLYHHPYVAFITPRIVAISNNTQRRTYLESPSIILGVHVDDGHLEYNTWSLRQCVWFWEMGTALLRRWWHGRPDLPTKDDVACTDWRELAKRCYSITSPGRHSPDCMAILVHFILRVVPSDTAVANALPFGIPNFRNQFHSLHEVSLSLFRK